MAELGKEVFTPYIKAKNEKQRGEMINNKSTNFHLKNHDISPK